MVKFLIKRPIAVFMITIALIVLGLVATKRIPTSLLPEISIPKITIFVNYPNHSAREIETNITRKLKNQLLQVAHLKEIQTNSLDGQAILHLTFDYGTNTDYAFIEANEKIDAVIANLPKDMERPKVVKASASDIPILNLTVALKNNYSDEKFLELSDFSQNIIKNRLEQLPEIALADISGKTNPEIVIIPNKEKLLSLNLDNDVIINAIKNNNFEFNNLIIQNGIYQYNFKLGNSLKNIKDIENIYINVHNHLLQIKDIASIKYVPQIDKGMVLTGNKRAIVFSIIKQADAQVSNLKEKLDVLIKNFIKDYPNLKFSVNQDQSKLLKISLNNLKQSLIAGSVLAILILFFFLKDFKSPLIIALTIPVSLIISILFMYFFKMSINIISLSGLILGVGMMIDNSIIVIDNITQKIEDNFSLQEAIAKGTTEIISPLITSVLTTVSVFLPLVFLSGITGALFIDQALSVTIGLGVSLVVSIILIPVVYKLLHQKKWKLDNYLKNTNKFHLENWYKKGYLLFFDNKKITLSIAVLGILLGVLFFSILPYKKMPVLKHNDTILKIDFNQNITVAQTQKNIQILFNQIDTTKTIVYSEIGKPQFLFNQEQTKQNSEAKIYIKTTSNTKIKKLENILTTKIKNTFPDAKFNFLKPKNAFEQIFGSKISYLTAKVYNNKNSEIPKVDKLLQIKEIYKLKNNNDIQLKKSIELQIIFENLLLYDVDYNTLINELKAILNQKQIDNLKSANRFIPIQIKTNTKNLYDIVNYHYIKNKKGKLVPIRNLIKTQNKLHYKNITADKYGEYLGFNIKDNQLQNFKSNTDYTVKFGGAKFELTELRKELVIVVIISILLLYFIMAAQFESLLQPIIILLEIPIDIGGALLLVWFFGGSINVMTIIGLVVMSGIVINDSILKIHTINQLIKDGMSVKKAIETAGKLRLKPILMTSLTTILAMLPFLFISGIGADLQKPLALVVIGGLTLGTFISLYFVPIMYYLFSKKS